MYPIPIKQTNTRERNRTILTRRIGRLITAALFALTLALSFVPTTSTHAQETTTIRRIDLVVDGSVVTFRSMSGNIALDRQVALVRLYNNDPTMQNWAERARAGDRQAIKDIELILYDQYNYAVGHYWLLGAFPIKLEYAVSSQGLLERVTLAYEKAFNW